MQEILSSKPDAGAAVAGMGAPFYGYPAATFYIFSLAPGTRALRRPSEKLNPGSIVALNRSGGGLEVVVRSPLEAVEEEDSAGESKL